MKEFLIGQCMYVNECVLYFQNEDILHTEGEHTSVIWTIYIHRVRSGI